MDGVFFEAHPDPARALSDAATQLPLEQAAAFLEEALRVHEAVRETSPWLTRPSRTRCASCSWTWTAR